MTIDSTFFYWGPLLTHSTLSEKDMEIVDSIYDRSFLKKINHSHDLQTHFENEFLIDKVDNQLLSEIISPHINHYLNFYKKSFASSSFISKNPTMGVSWINYQQPFEFRPPHKHGLDLIYILYVDIPNELIKESELNDKEPAGCIFFNYGFDQVCLSLNLPPNTQHFIFPKRGDIFLFPSYLTHYSIPFKSQVVRKSISGNYQLV